MEPVVTTKAGAVRSVRGAFGSHVFLGIPYALPPLGELRYLAPVPARWDGVRDADRYGATAPQPEHGMTLIPEPIIPGDDFLHLNVVTPDPGAAGLPVLVWIHGGGFTSGCNASPWYRGERFARDGVVVVAINYRLGAEGFLALDGAPANRALLDWIAALRWVQDNIAAFGGDPARVTIAGQSAGGGACGTLLAVPEARGLFRAAIPMSGAAQMTIPAKRAQEFAARFAEAQGVPPTRSAFAALSVSEVVATQQRLTAMGSGAPIEPATLGRRIVEGLLPLAPSVDGDLLPASPIAMIRDGAGAGVPVLVGNTTEEFGMLAATSLAGADQAGLASALAAMGLPDDRATHYLSDSRPPALVLAQAVTDRTFRIPSVRLAEAHSAAATWVYEFAWRSPARDGALGAGHCLDLPFVFDDLSAPGVAEVAGDHPPQHLADAMHGAWVSFVTDLDPGWTPYAPGQRATMVFDTDPHLADDPLQKVRDVWEGIA